MSKKPSTSFLSPSTDTNNGISRKRLIDLESGKTRTKPHVTGNWSTHIFIPIESPALMELQAELLELFKGPSDQMTAVHKEAGLHVSLSRTVYPKTHQVDPLLKALQAAVHATTSPIHSRSLALRQEQPFHVYSNDEGSRYFLSLDFDQASNETLAGLSASIDKCLQSFGLDPFYPDPKYHVSILWSPSEVFTAQLARPPKLNPALFSPLQANQLHIRAGSRLLKLDQT